MTDNGHLRYVLVRCTAAGVHAGYLVEQVGHEVQLANARRIWCWAVPVGAPDFLSGVATCGLDHKLSKVGCRVSIRLLDACEVIDCTDVAKQSIEGAQDHVRP